MRSWGLILSACIVVAGCGFASPPGGASSSTTSAPGAARQAGPAPAPPAQQPNPYDSPLAGELLVAFATAYINWNAHTVVADMRRLAAESVGQARSAMEMAAAETARDYELQRGGIANSGRVEAVAPLTNSGSRWVIVTRERTTATNSSSYQGLAPAWHVIVAAVVELSPGRWAVSLWQPQS